MVAATVVWMAMVCPLFYSWSSPACHIVGPFQTKQMCESVAYQMQDDANGTPVYNITCREIKTGPNPSTIK